MTTRELIELLKQYPEDAIVGMNQDGIWEVHSKDTYEFLGYLFD